MSAYYSGDGLGLQHLGQNADQLTPPERPSGWNPMTTPWQKAMMVAGTVSVPVLAYHGYRRNDSVGWAIVWGLFGSWVWPITVPVAFAQGYAKRKTNRNRRRRRRTSRRTHRRTSRRRR